MSGDSPNALGNDNVFDFKDGRSSPGPTTSKHDQGASGVVNASVLVEPHKEKKDTKDHEEKEKEEDKPDFCSPIYNNPDESGKDGKEGRRGSEGGKDNDHSYPLSGGGGGKKEVQNLLNGDMKKEAYVPQKDYDEESDEDTCIVNCLYYTMECCKCSIL